MKSREPSPPLTDGFRKPRTPRWTVLAWALIFFGLALGARLISLDQHLTADDQDWIRRVVRFNQAVQRKDWADTYQSSHPAVTVLWLGSLAVGPDRSRALAPLGSNLLLLEKSPAYLSSIFDTRRALAVASALLTTLTAFLVWRLFGNGPGLLAGLLLLTEPYLVAHGRLLHADPLLAHFMTVSVLSGLLFFSGRAGSGYLVLSGLTAGLALLTKAPAIFLFGFVPLFALGLSWRRAGSPQRIEKAWLARHLIGWAVVAICVCLFLWPTLWSNPFGTLRSMASALSGAADSPRIWGNFFLGRVYREGDIGPLFYPLMTLLRLSPVTLLGLLMLLIGLVRETKTRWRPELAVLGAGVFLFMLMMTLSPRKVDRFMLPVLPLLAVLAAVGWHLGVTRGLRALQARSARVQAISLVAASRRRRRAYWTAAALVGIAQAALLAGAQPYPLSFFNPLLGGSATARETVVVGWGEGTDQVAAYLSRQPDAREIVVSSLYNDLIQPLFPGRGAQLSGWQRADYLADYINMDQRDLVPGPLKELVRTQPPVFSARINGLDYVRLYAIPPELKAAGGPSGAPQRSGDPVR